MLPVNGSPMGHRHAQNNTGYGKWLQHERGSSLPALDPTIFPRSPARCPEKIFLNDELNTFNRQ
jgi:hypothetical protein